APRLSILSWLRLDRSYRLRRRLFPNRNRLHLFVLTFLPAPRPCFLFRHRQNQRRRRFLRRVVWLWFLASGSDANPNHCWLVAKKFRNLLRRSRGIFLLRSRWWQIFRSKVATKLFRAVDGGRGRRAN